MNKAYFTKAFLLALVLCSLLLAHVGAQPDFLPQRSAVPRTEILANNLPEPRVQAAFSNILLAIENKDYSRFEQAITLNFQAQTDKESFQQLYGTLGTRLERSYRIIFMGELNKPGFKTFVYKLIFKDSRGEVLTTVSFNANKDGKMPDDPELKAAGFYVH